jgi:negative regulator of sigma E activity
MLNDANTLANYKFLLSCLSDGELSDLETQDLLQAINDNTELKRELRGYWTRLQSTNQIIHRQTEYLINEALTIEVSDKLLSALEKEGTDIVGSSDVLAFASAATTTKPESKQDRLSNLTSFAIAASVMFVVTFAWLGSQSSVQESVLAWFSAQTEAVQVATQQPNSTQTLDTRFQSKDSILVGLNSSDSVASNQKQKPNDLYLSEHRIEDYMLLHAEHASLNTNQGMMPFARITKVSKSNQF